MVDVRKRRSCPIHINRLQSLRVQEGVQIVPDARESRVAPCSGFAVLTQAYMRQGFREDLRSANLVIAGSVFPWAARVRQRLRNAQHPVLTHGAVNAGVENPRAGASIPPSVTMTQELAATLVVSQLPGERNLYGCHYGWRLLANLSATEFCMTPARASISTTRLTRLR